MDVTISNRERKDLVYRSVFHVEWHDLERYDLRRGYALMFLKNWLSLYQAMGAMVNVTYFGTDEIRFQSNFPEAEIFKLATDSTNQFIIGLIKTEPDLGAYLSSCRVIGHPEFSL